MRVARRCTSSTKASTTTILVCLDCGKVEEFYDAEIEKRQHAVAKAKGFTIADHALSLYANCTKDKCPHRNNPPT